MSQRIRRSDPQRRRYWEEAVRRWREGGQSVRAFCHAEGLRESAFYFWRRKLAPHGQRACKRGTSRPAPEDVALGPPARPAVAASESSARVSPRHGLAPSFLPVQVVESTSQRLGVSASPCGVEIVLAQGRRVRVQAGFDRQTLADVLAVLEALPC